MMTWPISFLPLAREVAHLPVERALQVGAAVGARVFARARRASSAARPRSPAPRWTTAGARPAAVRRAPPGSAFRARRLARGRRRRAGARPCRCAPAERPERQRRAPAAEAAGIPAPRGGRRARQRGRQHARRSTAQAGHRGRVTRGDVQPRASRARHACRAAALTAVVRRQLGCGAPVASAG